LIHRCYSKERNEDVSILNGFKEDTYDMRIPRTKEQVDVNMVSDMSGEVPQRREAEDKNAAIIASSKVRFQNMRLFSPRYEVAELPEYLAGARRECEGGLVHPQHRRELLDFETKQHEATKHMKTAVQQRMRTKSQIQGAPFYRGILSVDSCSNENSELYGERARASNAVKLHRQEAHSLRRQNLAHSTSSILTNGNIIVPDSLPENVLVRTSFQSKQRATVGPLSFAETQKRLFYRAQVKQIPHNKERAQLLRDQDLSGKDYNIVTHAAITDWPSRPLERSVHRDMAHPSQASLEAPRNTLGSLLGRR
jgi:hypothetical protein